MKMPECPECGANKISMSAENGINCMICGKEIAPPLSEIGD